MGSAMHCRTRIALGSLIISIAAPLVATVSAQTPAFVAPPRTIADITAILDQEKPDPKVAAKMRADANAAPPANLARGELARFLYRRCQARSELGEFRKAVEDCEKAADLGRGWTDMNSLGRF